MFEIKAVLRSWLQGQGLRTAAERAGVDGKTDRRYVEAAQDAGRVREDGESAVTNELLGAVPCVRPGPTATVRPASG